MRSTVPLDPAVSAVEHIVERCLLAASPSEHQRETIAAYLRTATNALRGIEAELAAADASQAAASDAPRPCMRPPAPDGWSDVVVFTVHATIADLRRWVAATNGSAALADLRKELREAEREAQDTANEREGAGHGV